MILTINVIEIIILIKLITLYDLSYIAIILISLGLIITEELMFYICDKLELCCCTPQIINFTRISFYGLLIAAIIC